MGKPTLTAAITEPSWARRYRGALTPPMSSVIELWPEVCAAPFRCTVENRPQRPHEVDVSLVLAWVRGSEKQLAAPVVMDLPVAANEDGRHRQLAPIRLFGLVVGVVCRVRRGEQARVSPAAGLRVHAEALDRRLGDDGKVDPLRDVRHLTVDGIDDRRATRAGLLER